MFSLARATVFACLILVSNVAYGAIGTADPFKDDGWEVIMLPVCVSQERAGEVYWAGVLHGTLVAELFYLEPMKQRGECAWSSLYLPRHMRVLCQIQESYDCDGVEWRTRYGWVYIIIWPK